ncbi:ribonuclease P protein component [Patescibacteria group bacterium]|nr:ribonuclease P protein component [Patescibacteria group bacterium]
MLAKKYRLPIQSTRDMRGRTIPFPEFSVKVFPSPFPYARFGVVLKKGTVKKASDRTRLRRIFFNALREMHAPKLLSRSDLLFIVNAAASRTDAHDLTRSVAAAVRGIAR